MSLKDYIIRDIQEKFKYLPSAVYLALICIAMYIFVCLLRYLFTMREVSQADERRKKIVGKICGTFVAYMYTLIMIVYYSREPGSRTGVADMVLWSTWGMTLQMHAYFIENIVLFIPFGLLFPLVFKNWMRWFTIPVGAFISAAIEYTQLVTGRGYCQLDDFVTNTAGALPLFYNKITQVFDQMSQASETAGLSYELIIVDDGSMDGTLDVAKELAANDSGVKYISFSRNFGKEAAMYAGLQHAVGEYVAIMDADLQDPPEMLPKMYQVLNKEGYDAVGTRRVTRKGEPAIRSFFARKFYRLMSRISKANMVDGARDYRLMNRKYVDALLSLKEYNRFSKGLFGWVGFKVKWLEFENVNRVAGETKWSFWQLFLYSLDGIVAFSNAPLYMASIAGVFSFIVAIIAMLFIIIRRLVFGDPVAGWASTVVIILFIGGIQLLSIGILGLYLSKLYLEAKDRPIYLIGESNIEKPTEKN